jgi:hypothetical protein
MTDDNEVTRQDIIQHMKEDLDWPQYFVSGEDVDEDDFVPAYYKVEGPSGPVSYMNPNSGPYPTTMYDFAMEAQADSFRYCKRGETPWGEDA